MGAACDLKVFEVQGLSLVFVGSVPHPVMGTTNEYYRYMKAPINSYLVAITLGGIDLT